ncbi:MAG TPA: N-6 DNA methylase [Gaiellaceae bacterium]|nr:N-6 DNA methylase [Gaiellaceae bacterium]
MTAIRLPSFDVSEEEKRRFSEAEVHSSLFEPDMLALGYPARTTTHAAGEYFQEQRTLALRRLKSGCATGRYDGLYLIGNSPVVLCEIKRYGAIDAPADFERAKRQLVDYARSEDFAEPPPFLVLYCGKPERTRFFVRKTIADPSLLGTVEYEELPEIWEWWRVKQFQARGEFALEVVDRERLREILLYHLDRIEDGLRSQVNQAIQVVKGSPGLIGGFGQWLQKRPEALERMRALYDRKVAEVGRDSEQKVAGEMVTQAALNYLNKVFFLSLCEDRHLPGFYKIMREFLPRAKAETTPETAAAFLGLLRRRIKDATAAWDPQEETVYRQLRQELTPSIQAHVIEQNSWRELIQVAFDLAAEHFPLVYREDAYDYFRPEKDALAELIYDLSTKSFEALTNRHVGDIYQALLSSRRTQQAKLGAFYTPRGDVDYMVSKLALTRESRVLDPCMGSGHFLEGLYEHLLALYEADGIAPADAYRQIVQEQIYGADVDSFALSLSAIRMFLLSDPPQELRLRLYAHDMLLHSPERPAMFTDAEAVVADPELDEVRDVDLLEFDAVVGNPPYGARKPAFKAKVYGRLYGPSHSELKAGSLGTGDRDTYAMFLANGIQRLREGGRLCLITQDGFRTLTTYANLRRYILDRCKIVEILLTDTKHFEGVSFQFAGMAITTLEKCSDPEARRANVMRLVDYIRDPKDFWTPGERLSEWRQEEYEALEGTPFFVGVPREVFEAANASIRVRDVARGRVGLQTGDDKRFTAPIDHERVKSAGVATDISADEQRHGIPVSKPHWVPLAKGEGYGEYWKPPSVAIDWSEPAVAELERRAALPAGTPRKTYFRNREFYFRPGLTYSVISSGRVSMRLLPAGCVWTDKGSAVLVEDDATSELFVLGYLNSALATYFMKKIVNATATAHAGYIEKLPYRRPSAELEAAVVERVEQIVAALQSDPGADIQPLREEIDDLILDLFDIRASREEVKRFYRTVGLVERADEDQAATA